MVFQRPISWPEFVGPRARGPVGPWLVGGFPGPDLVARARGPVGPWLVGGLPAPDLVALVEKCNRPLFLSTVS